MGVVHRALQVQLKREVALKQMRDDVDACDDFVGRFKREALAMMRVHHPNVVTVLDVGTMDRLPYIAMELLQGRTLEERVRVEPHVARRQGDGWFEQVLEGVAALHAHGLVHRDLKPGNVMVTSDGRAVVMDLGLVMDFAGDGTLLTREGHCVGTPAYLAPEVVMSRPTTATADVWALGCIYFYLHAGRQLFRAENLAAMFTAITRLPLPDLAVACPDLPEHRRRFLSLLLERDPLLRPQDAGEALELFRRRRRRKRRLPLDARVPILLAGAGVVLSASVALLFRAPLAAPLPAVSVPAAPPPDVLRTLVRLSPKKLQAELHADLAAPPHGAAAMTEFATMLREKWKRRIAGEAAQADLASALRASTPPRPLRPDERDERYLLASALWVLTGQLIELGVTPDFDPLPLFPPTHRPEPNLPELTRAETIGFRWHPSELPPFTAGPRVTLVPVRQEQLRFYTDRGARIFGAALVDGLPVAALDYREPAPLPLRAAARGERVLASLGGKSLGPGGTLTVRLIRDKRTVSTIVFRGRKPTGHDELLHWVDPEALGGAVQVELEYRHPDSLTIAGEAFVYWLVFHYIP